MIYGFIMCIWYCHFMQVDTNIDSLHIISQILEWVCISIYLVIYYLRFTFSSLKEVSVAVLNVTGPLSNWSFSNNILPGDLSFSFCLQTYILHCSAYCLLSRLQFLQLLTELIMVHHRTYADWVVRAMRTGPFGWRYSINYIPLYWVLPRLNIPNLNIVIEIGEFYWNS